MEFTWKSRVVGYLLLFIEDVTGGDSGERRCHPSLVETAIWFGLLLFVKQGGMKTGRESE